MNYKERMIDTAATILAEMYDIPEKELRTVGKRNRIIIGNKIYSIYIMLYKRSKI